MYKKIEKQTFSVAGGGGLLCGLSTRFSFLFDLILIGLLIHTCMETHL